MLLKYLLTVAAAVTSTLARPIPGPQTTAPPPSADANGDGKVVVAHFIMGNAQNFSPQDWIDDINLAKQAHIDGFALNIAVQDATNDQMLEAAYSAAASVGNFKMFMSFDYLSGGPWPANQVIQKINAFADHPAQLKYQGKALVSTFEGVDNVNDWPSIKSATNCFFMPSWTSMGPGFADKGAQVSDGAFSWDMWPTGAEDKDTSTDEMWMNMLGNKPYMMGASAWFYTNLPQWGKNWLWRGDDLWFQRWQQIMKLQPALVEIVTWNDFGESHYIGPIHDNGVPEGANYVSNMTHDAWRTLLPYYIDAYKAGSTINPSVDDPDVITYWYRKNPSDAGSTGGTTGGNPAQGQPALPPAQVSQDKVFVSVLVKEASQVNVQIGGGQAQTFQAKDAGINHFSVPFNGRTGKVRFSITRGGQEVVSTEGPEITASCPEGKVNWNAVVGQSE